MNFQTGNVICSTNGKLSGGEFYNCDENSIQKFVGIYSGVSIESKTRRDEVFVSKGVIEVNVSEEIVEGDYLTTGLDGKAKKANSSTFIIGVAIEQSRLGKVKVALDQRYLVIK